MICLSSISNGPTDFSTISWNSLISNTSPRASSAIALSSSILS